MLLCHPIPHLKISSIPLFLPLKKSFFSSFKQPEKIGKYGKLDVTLYDGPYGKYVTCDNYKFNLNMLFNQQVIN